MKNLENIALMSLLCLLCLTSVSCFANLEDKEFKTDSLPLPTISNEMGNLNENNKQKQSAKTKCKDNDIKCFIRAAETCHSATLTNRYTVPVYDSEITQTVFYQIKGGNSEKCQFYLKILDWQSKLHKFTEAEKEELRREKEESRKDILKKGGEFNEPTEEQKKEGEEARKGARQAADKKMKDAIGTDGNCTFKTVNLAKLLERWSKDTFSSGDYKGANCRGTYFTEANGFFSDNI